MKFWDNLSDGQRGAITVSTIVLAIVLFIVTVVPMSYRNTIADQEVMVVKAKDFCAVQIDNGVKSIVQIAQVDAHTKEFLLQLFENASKNPDSDLAKQADAAYVQFVSGNTQPFMLLMSGLSGTDITATATAVQREISAQRSIMSACSTTLIGAQSELKRTLGFDASNARVKFPQKYIDLKPSIVPDPSLPDNDHDGRITVLDYRPPVDASVLNSFSTGESVPATNPYDIP